MVQIKAFSYNPNAKYQPSGVYKTKDPDIIKQTIEVKQPSDASVQTTLSSPTYSTKTCCLTSKVTPSFVPGIILRCDSGKTSYTLLYGVRPQGAAYHTKTTSLGTFRDSQNPCLCSTYTIKSAVSYLSSRHHYQRINPGMPLITQWMQKPMKKSALNST